MLEEGDPAPDFSLSRVDDHYATYMLSAAAREGPVVLAFLPEDAAAGSQVLAELAAVDWASLIDSIAVFAIGTDEEIGARLVEELDPPFPVLQDRDAYVTDLYEVGSRADGRGQRRGLVLADQSCTVQFAWEAGDAEEPVSIEDLEVAVSDLA